MPNFLLTVTHTAAVAAKAADEANDARLRAKAEYDKLRANGGDATAVHTAQCALAQAEFNQRRAITRMSEANMAKELATANAKELKAYDSKYAEALTADEGVTASVLEFLDALQAKLVVARAKHVAAAEAFALIDGQARARLSMSPPITNWALTNGRLSVVQRLARIVAQLEEEKSTSHLRATEPNKGKPWPPGMLVEGRAT